MKKWIAIFLSMVMLLGILAGCKKTEEPVEDYMTPDDEMTIAIAALARSVKAQKEAAKPVCYSVKGVRYLDGIKTAESTAGYDNEKMFAVVEMKYFEGETQIGSESTYTYVMEENGVYNIISATATTEKDETTKTYSILYTADSIQAVQSAWTTGHYGADMAYQTYGRLEDLILSAAMSQGGAKANVTSAKDFTLTITGDYKTEDYTVENNAITKFVWTEMTANGEDVNTWNYFWNITDVTLPDLADFTLITE